MPANDLAEKIIASWRWPMVGAIVLLGALGTMAALQYQRFNQATADIDRAEAVVRGAGRLVSVLTDAETGYRGYLLTDDPAFLEPYRGVDTTARAALGDLAALVTGDVDRRDDVGRLSSLVDARLDEMTTTLQRHDAGDRAGALAIVKTARGKHTMDDIRRISASLSSEARALAASRSDGADGAARAARGFGIAAVVAALMLSLLAWAVSRALERGRLEVTAATVARLEAERDAAATSQGLAESERFNRSLLDSSTDCIAVLSPAGAVTFLNSTGVKQLHVRPDVSLPGLPFTALWPESIDLASTALLTAARGGEGRFVASRTDDGATHWWDVIVTAAREGGRVTRVVATARDVTAQRRLDDERQALLASERRARSEAERAVRAKDDFVSTLSHELRTPLNAILGWVGVLRQDQSPDTVSKALVVIDRSSRRQSQMIDDLLDMGRILSGKLRLEIQRVDLAPVIEEAVLSAQPSAEGKGVRLVKALGSAAIVRGDASRLQQVVWNLVSNAVKFTPRGGQVQVTLHKVNSQVHVQVSDTGIGIPPSMLAAVFDRFSQADSSTTRRHGGLGLGLSIVKHLVELHGGSVAAASDGEGTGATFTVRLPLALTTPRAEAPVGSGTSRQAQAMSLLGLRVLVLDDEEDARDVVTRLLEAAGASVTAAASAAEAERILEGGLGPDVVVSDVGMPDRDGYEFIRSVRRMPPPLRTVPAAALTALARLEDRKRAMLSGFQTHLAKPVDPDELVATVASLAGRTGRS